MRETPVPEEKSRAAQMLLMGACYSLGTFTDNFYKQTAVLMAAALSMTGVQSWATVLFSLPFVLFSAWAGWLADRAPKKNTVVGAKALELCAMLAGAWMLLSMNWNGILAVMFLMAAQSTLFSPAINGSIPEYFPPWQVPRVNAAIKAASTLAILAGMALAGFFLDLRPQSLLSSVAAFGPEAAGRAAAGLLLAALSAFGLVLSLFLKKKDKAPGPAAPFPRSGPLASVAHALESRRDPGLFLVLLADCWFYGIAVIAVISIANLAVGQGWGNTAAGLLTAVLMVGVAAGSLLAGKKEPESWRALLLPSACGMGVFLLLCSLTPFIGRPVTPFWFGLCLFACGLCGGLYLIPLESYIQVRPEAREKGKIIALSNFMSFTAMAVFGAAFQVIGLLPPAGTFVVYGCGTLLFALLYAAPRLQRLPGASLADAARTPFGLFLRGILSLRYRIRASGAGKIAPVLPDRGGTLFIANHPSLMDPLICWSHLAGSKARPLADNLQMSGPAQRLAGAVVRAITIPDITRDGKSSASAVRQALDTCADALKQGENVLLFPSGRASRDGGERLGANSAVFRLLCAAPGTRLVAIRLSGLWGSSFSYAFGNRPDFVKGCLRGLLSLPGNLFFFCPRREVDVSFCEMTVRTEEGKNALNKSIEAFFAGADARPVRVARYFWQKKSVPL